MNNRMHALRVFYVMKNKQPHTVVHDCYVKLIQFGKLELFTVSSLQRNQ